VTTEELNLRPQATVDVESLSEQRRELIEALPALLVVTTATGEIDEISESYTAYTGLSLIAAKDWEANQVIHPDDVDQAMARWSDALSSGLPMQNEMRLRRYDGEYRWHLVQAVPFPGQPRWLTVSIDIEDRKRAEQHEAYLAEVTARLVSALASPDLLASVAQLAVPELADICAIGLFDDSPQTARVETAGPDAREQPLAAKIHLRRWRAEPGSTRTIGETILARSSVFAPNFSPEWIDACAPDQEQREVALAIDACSIACVPLVAQGKPIGMATFATTRSKRRYNERDFALLTEVAGRLSIAIENQRLVQDLRAANATKDEFLGLVSHELKSPLTTIHGNAEVLLKRGIKLDGQIVQDSLRDIIAESERLHALIDNLLLLARLEQGHELDREPVLVIEIVRRVLARHQSRFPARRFKIVERQKKRRPVNFAEIYLEQVIENLVSNAEKYSPAGEVIVIEIERTDVSVTLRVLDRGKGVQDEETERLFQAFYRAEDTAKRVAGLGVGLAVCKRLV
jgi:PAS domain S-box-containing protein